MHKLFKSILCFCLVTASAGETTDNQSSTTTITQATITTTVLPITADTITATTSPTTTGTTPTATAGTITATTPPTITGTTPTATAGTITATMPPTITGTTPSTTAGTITATTPPTITGTTPTITAGTITATTPPTTTGTTPTTTTGPTPATTAANTASTMPATTAATTDGTTPATTAGTTHFTTAANTSSTTPATMPATTDGTTPATTAATTTKGPCTPNPCIGNGICEERHGPVFVCTCRPGLVYYYTTGCIPAKVFPGDFTLKGGTYKKEMSDTKSQIFKEKAEEIQEQLQSALQADNGYLYSLVLSLKNGSIIAEVRNFYGISSNATTESVKAQIEKRAPGSFSEKSVCDVGFCDENTTSCVGDGDGTAVCTCRKGYIKSEFSTQSCFSCPNGKKTDDLVTCKNCDFGFSGFNCNDPYLMVVVVVSCVMGTLLIIFAVALIVVSSRKQKGNSSKSKEDFSVEMQKPTEVPRIPRVNPASNWQPANLEVTNSGSTEALVTKSQRDNKARYTTYDNDSDDGRNGNQGPSVYGGVRVMENGLRGNQNPYYRQDEDRMRRY